MNEIWLTNQGDRVTVFQRRGIARSRWYWNVRADNNEIVEHGEGYSRRIDAVTAAERHHPRAEVEFCQHCLHGPASHIHPGGCTVGDCSCLALLP